MMQWEVKKRKVVSSSRFDMSSAIRLTAIPASSGIVLGRVHIWSAHSAEPQPGFIGRDQLNQEIERFRHALCMARGEVRGLKRRVSETIGEKQAAIFDAHEEMLSDPSLTERTIESIRCNLYKAEYSFHLIMSELVEHLSGIEDEYFRRRNTDLMDVGRRVLNSLMLLGGKPENAVEEGAIIVAEELTPSDTAMLIRHRIGGFCTALGGSTSHTAIMARALRIPAVVGLGADIREIHHGDEVIVDGSEGLVMVRPGEREHDSYEIRREAWNQELAELSLLINEPAVTRDGMPVELLANVELIEEADHVLERGAEGIGLFRTEFLYLNAEKLPEEDEQEAMYRRLFKPMDQKKVILRTLDIGGDKLFHNAQIEHANPLMGLRALRLSLHNEQIFRTQLRAMLRAAQGHTLSVMFPMVADVCEFRRAKNILLDEAESLQRNGIHPPGDLQIGAMIETPSAAWTCAQIAAEADFLSLGTNDLIQYTLVVDRANRHVAHLYDPLHPAMLRVLSHVATAAREANTRLSVCGEMAGDPRCALVLLGLGIRSFSMGPASICPVKQVIRSVTTAEAGHLARDLMAMTSSREIQHRVDEAVRALARHSPSGDAHPLARL